jgi:hypothetical protein
MAELTHMETKLAEVLGLAQAAKGATDTVRGMLDDDEAAIAERLERMGAEAQETASRCEDVAGRLDGKKTAILEQARTVKQDATEMMKTYLQGEDEALDGFEWLTMAEAGEVGHWRILQTMSERAGNADISELAEWAIPIQEGHFRAVTETSLQLASAEDPNEPAG